MSSHLEHPRGGAAPPIAVSAADLPDLGSDRGGIGDCYREGPLGRESADATLRTTSLVHEAYLKLTAGELDLDDASCGASRSPCW